jgi:ribosomal protein S18 acetylase RimI-like enzyme
MSAYKGLMPDSVLDNLSVDAREAGWRHALSPETNWTRFQVLVIDLDGQLAGFSSAGPSRDEDASPDRGEIYAIYVDPAHVGTGLGRILFAHTLEDVRSRGYAVATLWVLDSNDRARRFYERAGGKTDGATKRDEVDGFELREVRYRFDLS